MATELETDSAGVVDGSSFMGLGPSMAALNMKRMSVSLHAGDLNWGEWPVGRHSVEAHQTFWVIPVRLSGGGKKGKNTRSVLRRNAPNVLGDPSSSEWGWKSGKSTRSALRRNAPNVLGDPSPSEVRVKKVERALAVCSIEVGVEKVERALTVCKIYSGDGPVQC